MAGWVQLPWGEVGGRIISAGTFKGETNEATATGSPLPRDVADRITCGRAAGRGHRLGPGSEVLQATVTGLVKAVEMS